MERAQWLLHWCKDIFHLWWFFIFLWQDILCSDIYKMRVLSCCVPQVVYNINRSRTRQWNLYSHSLLDTLSTWPKWEMLQSFILWCRIGEIMCQNLPEADMGKKVLWPETSIHISKIELFSSSFSPHLICNCHKRTHEVNGSPTLPHFHGRNHCVDGALIFKVLHVLRTFRLPWGAS